MGKPWTGRDSERAHHQDAPRACRLQRNVRWLLRTPDLPFFAKEQTQGEDRAESDRHQAAEHTDDRQHGADLREHGGAILKTEC
jgi:hypothetical protein